MRIIALGDSCYECDGGVAVLSVPDEMDLVVEMAGYQKWYHDEYMNPSVVDVGYQSFAVWLVSHGAELNPPTVEHYAICDLRNAAPRLWTYERPRSDFDKYMEAHIFETMANYMVSPSIRGVSS